MDFSIDWEKRVGSPVSDLGLLTFNQEFFAQSKMITTSILGTHEKPIQRDSYGFA